ncbi:MAG: shikimate dehydrogenase [Clostridia bacterium]|nr:shikimate dehydrogenase [Clostridia bacterium]
MRFGLMGEHLAHSFSPALHAAFGTPDYELCEFSLADVPAFFAARNFDGVNVTIPYKETVIPYLDELSPEARTIGAVNTVVRRGDRLIGYNTDYTGLCALIRYAGMSFCGKKVLILGSGGTSRTALAAAKDAGVRSVFRVSRTPDGETISYADAASEHADADIIINTTPVGMFPHAGETPIELAMFPRLSGVIDVIYNPLRTALVLAAEARGIPAVGGLRMLVVQAAAASALFRGTEIREETTERVYRDLLSAKENLVLIGMPSAGKTSVGRETAWLLGRRFIDTDVLLEEKCGMTPADYLRTYGEDAFRDAEARVIAEISSETGLVVATGGGAVLRQENVDALRANGRLVWLDRSPEKLSSTNDRPLSSSPEQLRALYDARLPLYRAAADCRIDGNGDVSAVARDTAKRFQHLIEKEC